ncbi:hypothetical protein JL721_11893 [Aureococcus anophagefferens]|nr:hypothetical protein JL721_11893 [Aureococcus anophagefferens]
MLVVVAAAVAGALVAVLACLCIKRRHGAPPERDVPCAPAWMAPGDGLETHSVEELKAMANARGVSLAGRLEKTDIIAALRAAAPVDAVAVPVDDASTGAWNVAGAASASTEPAAAVPSAPRPPPVNPNPFMHSNWYNTDEKQAERVVVCDFAAVAYHVLSKVETDASKLLGGQYAVMARETRAFVERFERVGAELVFVVGRTATGKDRLKHGHAAHTLASKAIHEARAVELVKAGRAAEAAAHSKKALAPMKNGAVVDALLDLAAEGRVEVLFGDDEDDPGVAYEAAARHGWVLSGDTDMVAYRYEAVGSIQGVIFLKDLDWTTAGLTFLHTTPALVAAALGLVRDGVGRGELMPLVATLLGNDYVDDIELATVHDHALHNALLKQQERWHALDPAVHREAMRELPGNVRRPCLLGHRCKNTDCPYDHSRSLRFFCNANVNDDNNIGPNYCTRPYTCRWRHRGDAGRVPVWVRAGAGARRRRRRGRSGRGRATRTAQGRTHRRDDALGRRRARRGAVANLRRVPPPVERQFSWAIIRGVADAVAGHAYHIDDESAVLDAVCGAGTDLADKVRTAVAAYEPRRADLRVADAPYAVGDGVAARYAYHQMLSPLRDRHLGDHFDAFAHFPRRLGDLKLGLVHGAGAAGVCWLKQADDSIALVERRASSPEALPDLAQLLASDAARRDGVLALLGASDLGDLPAPLLWPLATLRFWLAAGGEAMPGVEPPPTLGPRQIRAIAEATTQRCLEARLGCGAGAGPLGAAARRRARRARVPGAHGLGPRAPGRAGLLAIGATGDRPELRRLRRRAPRRLERARGGGATPTSAWERYDELAARAAGAAPLVDALVARVTEGLAVDATPQVAFQARSVSETVDSWEDEGDDAPTLPVDANAAWGAVVGGV